jgi:hypothetical protein
MHYRYLAFHPVSVLPIVGVLALTASQGCGSTDSLPADDRVG